MMRSLSLIALCSLLVGTSAKTVHIGRSSDQSTLIWVGQTVKKCHPYPANECCGHLFQASLQNSYLNVTRVDYKGGWQQSDLKWECETDTDPMFLPVEFRWIPSGVNCHNLYNPKPFFERQPRATVWTTQINMRITCFLQDSCIGRDVPDIYKKFMGLPLGTNFVATWHTSLRIFKGGTYTFVKQIGYAETAIAFLNGVEMFRSRCREPLVTVDLKLDEGVYDLTILQQDDGWEDSIMFQYNGPDTKNKLRIIGNNAFLKPCGPNQFYDKKSNYQCKDRSSQCGNNQIRSTRADEDCVQCETSGVHRCVNGVYAPLTTQHNGQWFSRTLPATTVAPHEDPPGCDGCGYRIKACSRPLNDTWDMDYIQFLNKGVGVDTMGVTLISSGYDHGKDANHDYDHTSYEPRQAFGRSFNIWRGKGNGNGEFYIGMMSDKPMAIDQVEFMSGNCAEKGVVWWARRSPNRVFNITRCVSFEKWDGSKWVTLGRTGNIVPCRVDTIKSNGDVVTCPCASVGEGGKLGDGVCQEACDVQTCQHDLGDCRLCPSFTEHNGLPAIKNGQYKFLNGTGHTDKTSTLSTVAQVVCDKGYQLSQPESTVVCNTSNVSDWESAALWYWKGKQVPTCGPLKCFPPQVKAPLRITNTDPNNVLVFDKFTFACDEHSEVTHESVGCVEENGKGKLAKAIPTCTPLKCDAEALDPVKNGIMNVKDDISGGEGIEYSCEPGYTLNGPSEVKCLQEKWDRSPPTCDIKSCTTQTIQNGAMDTSIDMTFMSESVITCDEGYELVGSQATCQLTSDKTGVEWSTLPTCQRIMCEVCISCITTAWYNHPAKPIKPGNGDYKDGDKVPWGTVVSYSCDSDYGFFMVPANQKLTCGNGGQWDVDQPICENQQCDALKSPQFGSMSPTERSQERSPLNLQDTSTFKCQDGYQVGEVVYNPDGSYVDGDQSTTLTCVGGEKFRDNGGWDKNKTVTCVPRGCPKPPSRPGYSSLAVEYPFYKVTDQVQFNCDNTDNNEIWLCTSDQKWVQQVFSNGDVNGFNGMNGCLTAAPTTATPTFNPTPEPTSQPSTSLPTTSPSQSPTKSPASSLPTSNPTKAPLKIVSDESTGGLDEAATMGVALTSIVFVVVLVAILAVFILLRGKKAQSDADRVGSFDNPMYEGSPNAYEDPSSGGNQSQTGAYDNVTMANTGYMDVPAANNGGNTGSGYMDVAPADAGNDDDDFGNASDDDDDDI